MSPSSSDIYPWQVQASSRFDFGHTHVRIALRSVGWGKALTHATIGLALFDEVSAGRRGSSTGLSLESDFCFTTVPVRSIPRVWHRIGPPYVKRTIYLEMSLRVRFRDPQVRNTITLIMCYGYRSTRPLLPSPLPRFALFVSKGQATEVLSQWVVLYNERTMGTMWFSVRSTI